MSNAHDWDEHYAGETLPWDTGVPDADLAAVIEAHGIRPGRALEVGCGTGTNAVWLAQRGFTVVALDFAPRAVARARDRAAAAGVAVDVRVADFLRDEVPGGPFDFVFDRGCLHVFDEETDRARFAANVARVLADGGAWLSLAGSTEGAPRDGGPPRRSARDLVCAIEPSLAIVELRGSSFEGIGDTPLAAWRCLARRRAVPAAPSTRR